MSIRDTTPAAARAEEEVEEQVRRPWTPPVLETLPRLTELTLQTGGSIPGGGDVGGGGSTVF